MKEINKKNFCITIVLFLMFVLWTVAISYIDVQVIGPKYSTVGFATFNGFFHSLTGEHMTLYIITDYLGLIPLCIMVGFAILGFVQLIKRKSLLKVDFDILVLGGFYILVMFAYIFFELFIVNYRPLLISGYLEASYPSSTTLLVMCIIPTTIMQLRHHINNKILKKVITYSMVLFAIFMVLGRLISGVHWFTDIVGGILLSTTLVMLYYTINGLIKSKEELNESRLVD